MKNKKILVWLLIATVTTAWLSYSYADSTSTWSSNTKKEFRSNFWSWSHRWLSFENMWFVRWFNWVELTDTEKTALQSMTAEQKKTFFEQKMTTEKAQRDAKETVIDKLLAWQTLTVWEETIRQEIIKERAERKTQIQARETQMQTIKAILEKKKNGETLTADEQATLDSFKGNSHGKWLFGRNR